MKLTIELSETQAYILRDALDAYSRLLAGQIEIAVMDPLQWFILEARKNAPKDEHGNLIETVPAPDTLRRHLLVLQSQVTRLEYGASFGIISDQIPDRARQAYDLLQVIRHAVSWHLNPKPESCFRTVDYDEPQRFSEKEELAKCEISP